MSMCKSLDLFKGLGLYGVNTFYLKVFMRDGFCASGSSGSPVIEITDVAQAESVKESEDVPSFMVHTS